MTRRIRDCLEKHLSEFGFDPYRYPSGENKSVVYHGEGMLSVADADDRLFTVQIARWLPGQWQP